MSNQPKRPSLLERAAQVYDFDAALKARPLPAVVAEAPPMPRVPAEPIAFVQPFVADAPAVSRPGRSGNVDREELEAAGFILPDAPVSALAEEFRIVKRQLLLAAMAGDDAKARRILIASALPGEGKTFCAVNLALSMANERDVEVLLVDADVAKPSILSTLGLENGPGIIDIIEDSSIDPESCVIRTDIPGLCVLPAGKPHNEATELIASDRTRAVIEALGRVPNRVVILDSPPVLAASPAIALASHVGQTVMIVRADQTGESDLRDALKLLEGCADIRLLLNGSSAGLGRRRYGSYYGYGK